MIYRMFIAALLMVAANGALAAHPNIAVEGVQMPAWVEHTGGAREPLMIGAPLGNKDRIVTGAGARALLRLADGSLIKLGENGVLALDELAQKKNKLKNVVTASLDVLAGAFRFTTQALYKFRGERDVKVRLVTISAGIRGTDLWGKSEKNRSTVCLIEGAIAVAHGDKEFTMDQPLSFYIASKDEPQLPVTPVDKAQLDKWAAETEIADGAGAARAGGKWRVYLGDADNQRDALELYDQLRHAGYAAEIRPMRGAAGLTYRVRISHLSSEQEADVLAGKLKGKMGIREPKVSK
jgi:hypothetical protein